MGHIISVEGVAANPKKIEDMNDWPTPKDLTSLRGFLGLTGYYRRFVKNYGKNTWPLTQLSNKKNNFQWGLETQQVFQELKKIMVITPILAILSFSKPFELETDVSKKGIGAVLSQEGRPVAYMSHKLSE